MNYSELASSIKGYLETDFPQASGNVSSEAQIKTFISNAEQRIYHAVNLPASQFYITKILPEGGQRYRVALPQNTLAVNSISASVVNGRPVNLLPKDYSFLASVFNLNDAVTTGDDFPRYYAYYNQSTLALAPYPNAGSNYTLDIAYFAYPTSITAAAGTSWLGDNFESVLLYGAMLEGATFIQADQDMMAVYVGRYQEALMELKQLADIKNRSDWYRNNIIPPMSGSPAVNQR